MGSSPSSPHAEEDNRLARLAIRYILCNPAITAPIPGLITVQQVDNVALAVKQRRKLDVDEKAALDGAMLRAWANLPHEYQWLRDWSMYRRKGQRYERRQKAVQGSLRFFHCHRCWPPAR